MNGGKYIEKFTAHPKFEQSTKQTQQESLLTTMLQHKITIDDESLVDAIEPTYDNSTHDVSIHVHNVILSQLANFLYEHIDELHNEISLRYQIKIAISDAINQTENTTKYLYVTDSKDPEIFVSSGIWYTPANHEAFKKYAKLLNFLDKYANIELVEPKQTGLNDVPDEWIPK